MSKRLAAIAALIVVFVLGGVVGSILTHKHVTATIRDTMMQEGPPGMARFMVRMISRELSITDEQMEDFTAIMDAHQERMHEVFRDNAPRVEEIFQETKHELLQILDEEQQKRFLEMEEHRRETIMRFMDKEE